MGVAAFRYGRNTGGGDAAGGVYGTDTAGGGGLAVLQLSISTGGLVEFNSDGATTGTFGGAGVVCNMDTDGGFSDVYGRDTARGGGLVILQLAIDTSGMVVFNSE